MNKSNVTNLFKNFGRNIKKHSPEILTGVGIAGMVTTTILAVKVTPKAMQLIEEEKTSLEPGKKFTVLDTVKVAWKPYIPAVVTGTLSVACLVGASATSIRRNAALYSAYKLSETALSEYKENVVETIGEKKEKVVREKIAKDKIEKNPVSNTEVIITEKGNTLCYDAISGRYFKSDIETIKRAVNELNRRMIGGEMYVSLSDLYDEIGLRHTRISDNVGWNIDDGTIDPDFSTQLTEDNQPCVVLDFLLVPRYNFDNLY